jgi:hypothetical protein
MNARVSVQEKAIDCNQPLPLAKSTPGFGRTSDYGAGLSDARLRMVSSPLGVRSPINPPIVKLASEAVEEPDEMHDEPGCAVASLLLVCEVLVQNESVSWREPV